MNKFLLTNKNAVITGASSGIGRATAELFVKLGANVLITGRNIGNLEETAKKCESVKGNASQEVLMYIADLCVDNDVKKLAHHALTTFKKLDILVNSAGIIGNDTVENIDMAKFDKMINVNLRSIIHLTSLLSQSLIESKGSIINVSSVNGMRSFANVMTYCITKAALDQFTKCSALDLASKGVRVNAVSPGVTVTGLHRTAGMSEEAYQAFLERSKTTHALGRPGEAMETAYCIAFLASSASSFTTGALLPVDGGRNILCPR